MNRRLHSLAGGPLLLVLCVSAAMMVTSQAAWSQEVTANITGTVSDPSGAPIVGATAVATDTDRGTKYSARSNESGVFNINRIPIGQYSVRVQSTGFDTVVQTITLNLNQSARLDFQLKVGQVSETVQVTSAAPVLQTQSPEVSTLIDSNAAAAMPLASRNYLQLTLLAPGATTVNPDSIRSPQQMTNSGRPYINGNREQANQYFLDGQQNSEDKNNEVGYTPSIDAIQEFNIITQNPSAEFGNYEGGIVSASIKSGTNSFHGSLFEFLRNDKLNANLASAGWSRGLAADENTLGHDAQGVATKPELRYNMFGATIGGPIIKDKLFFFADYQGLRQVTASADGAQLLTTAMKGGDFSSFCLAGFTAGGLCKDPTHQLTDPGNKNAPFLNNQIPVTREDGVAKNILALSAYPTTTGSILAGNNFFFRSGVDFFNDQGDLKIDYNATPKDHLFGRWSQASIRVPTFSGCPICSGSNLGSGSASEGSTQPLRNAVIDWSHVVSGNLVNDARVGFNAVRFNQTIIPSASLGNLGSQVGITNGNQPGFPGLLNISIPAAGTGAVADLGQIDVGQIFHTTQGQFADDVNYIFGRHSIKTGFQYLRLRQDWAYNGNNGGLGAIGVSSSTGLGLADFFLGLAPGGSPRDTNISQTLFGNRGNVYAAYVQDNWRLTNTLTLNVGVRYEDHTPLTEVHNDLVNFGLFTGTIFTTDGRDQTTKFSNPALYNNYTGAGNWEPRFGFAWSPGILGGKTVIRGSYGLSSFFEGGGANEQLSINPPFGIVRQFNPGPTLESGFPNITSCPVIQFSCYAGQRIRIIDQNLRPAQNQQWNLTVQHQFSNTLTGQVGYVGQHGTHLANFVEVQQRIGLNAQGGIAKPGQTIVSQRAGPFLGGGSVPCNNADLAHCGTPGSLYQADQNGALAGANLSNANQSYNSLQAVLQKRMGNGLEAQVSYTYSKCLTNSAGYFGTGFGSTNATSSGGQPGQQNIYDPRSDWGPCYFDQRQILSSYVTYQLPFGRGKQFGHDMSPVLDAIVGNWDLGGIITVHSGNQLTLNEFGGWGTFSADQSNTNGSGPTLLNERPSCTGPIKIADRRVNADPASGAPGYIQWFDTSNIVTPAANTFGTCAVGNIRGPGYADTDLSLKKNFKISETKRLEFRAEALNAFNHPVWTFRGGPNSGSFDPGHPNNPALPFDSINTGSNSSNPNFGRITGSQGARQFQLAMKFYF